jgi:hypothetical protein
MAEWSIAAVLKTVELQGSGGSNPSLSAGIKKQSDEKSRNPMISGLLLFRGIAKNSKKPGF